MRTILRFVINFCQLFGPVTRAIAESCCCIANMENNRQLSGLRPWDSGSRHCWMLCLTVFCIPSSQSDRLSAGSITLALHIHTTRVYQPATQLVPTANSHFIKQACSLYAHSVNSLYKNNKMTAENVHSLHSMLQQTKCPHLINWFLFSLGQVCKDLLTETFGDC